MNPVLVILLNILLIVANVRKWEAAVKNDEKELEKVKNDEARHMKVRNCNICWPSDTRVFL